MELLRIDYIILKLLAKNKCFSFYESMSINEIMGVTDSARHTIYRKMMKLCEAGYIEKGCLDNHAQCYYITERGKGIIAIGGNKDD